MVSSSRKPDLNPEFTFLDMTSASQQKWQSMKKHISSMSRSRLRWFSADDSEEERQLILKIDLLLMPLSFVLYWTKYMDQSNINNAYVAGMKEELGFYGNELVHFQAVYTSGAVVGQIPFLFLLTHIPMHYAIPFLDVAWGVMTLLQYRTNSYAEMMVYRFFIGLFEAAFFPCMHFTFGSWYKSNEIARRGTFWYSAQNVGTLTAGLLQAAASSNLDGVCGLAGWRWLFIICAIITIPIGIIGFFVLPGTPDRPNRLVLKRRDIDLAVKRLSHAGHDTSDRLRLSTVGKVFTDKRTWAFLLLDVAFWNASLNIISGGFLLWLKSLKRYSPAKINSLGSISPALGILYNLLVGVISDLYLGPAWAITIAHTWNIIGLVILVIWHVPESALWFAFMTTYSANCISSVLYGWVNSSLRHSPAERGFTIVLINILAQSTVAWTPLLVFKTVEAPRFLKGYSYVLANALCFICLAHLVRSYLRKRDNSKPTALALHSWPDDEQKHRYGTSTAEELKHDGS